LIEDSSDGGLSAIGSGGGMGGLMGIRAESDDDSSMDRELNQQSVQFARRFYIEEQ
jgi:hypothetical protein